jgi:hypothetical protein
MPVKDRQVPPLRHTEMNPARNMPDAANAENSLQGYAAVNAVDEHEEVAKVAYQYYEQRGKQEGSADDDWFRAEEEVRRRGRLDEPSDRGGL